MPSINLENEARHLQTATHEARHLQTATHEAASHRDQTLNIFQSVPLDAVHLTAHYITNIPRSMYQQDPNRYQFELVISAIVKYYNEKDGQIQPGSIARLEMPSLNISFSSNSIINKDDRLMVDLGSLRGDTSFTSNSSGSSPLTHDGKKHKSSLNYSNNTNNCSITNSSSISGEGNAPINCSMWQYPVPPPNVAVIFEVFTGVKERRAGSYSPTWISTGASHRHISSSDPQGFRFIVPAETVMTTKLVTRIIGLSIGQVAVTITVPPPESPVFDMKRAVYRLKKFYSTAIAAFHGKDNIDGISIDDEIRRNTVYAPAAYSASESTYSKYFLGECDEGRSSSISSSGSQQRQQQSLTNPNNLSRTGVVRECIDECQIYTNIRRTYYPGYYLNRLKRLFNLYQFQKPTNAERIARLQAEWIGNEENMIKTVVMELGPELSSILPRHRMTAFLKKYRLLEADVISAFPNEVYSSYVLEHRTDEIFDALQRKYGNEPRPTSYIFPPVAYEPDRRIYILEHLIFPMNIPNSNKQYGDIALNAYRIRPAFIITPSERELVKINRSGELQSEIEYLKDKHIPEFRQIIPSIVEALTTVIMQHTNLQKPKDERFLIYETHIAPAIKLSDYVQRLADYTYISPSVMLAAMIFLDRLCERYPGLTLSDTNIFKLFLVSVRTASKIVDLRSLNNKNFASVGGVGNRQLNELEDIFLKYTKFDLFLTPDEFSVYSRRLMPPEHVYISRYPSSRHHRHLELEERDNR